MNDNFVNYIFFTGILLILIIIIYHNSISYRLQNIPQIIKDIQHHPLPIKNDLISAINIPTMQEHVPEKVEIDEKVNTPVNIIVKSDVFRENVPIAKIATSGQLMREYDRRTLEDPLVPPYKRDDMMIPIPTEYVRGLPTAFKKFGLLIDNTADNTDKFKFMILMARQSYPNSRYYDYYVTGVDKENILKFNIQNIHKELYSDDTITIPELNKTYTLQIDQQLDYRYNPYIF